MELTRSQDLIRQLKHAKEKGKMTYPAILEKMEQNGTFVSMSTLRRVFAANSEENAKNFNFESTLLPIAEAILNVGDIQSTCPSYMKEINNLHTVINVQDDEIAKLREINEHLEARVAFLLGQIELRDNRLDDKDKIIMRLVEKCL